MRNLDSGQSAALEIEGAAHALSICGIAMLERCMQVRCCYMRVRWRTRGCVAAGGGDGFGAAAAVAMTWGVGAWGFEVETEWRGGHTRAQD